MDGACCGVVRCNFLAPERRKTQTNVEETMSAKESVSPAQVNHETQERLFQLVLGYMPASALYVAVHLNLPDLLADGPKPVSALAKATGTSEDPLFRLLRALASVGVFTEVAPRQFALNDAAGALCSGSPLRDLAEWMTDPFHFQTYSHLLHSVRTGESAMEVAAGTPPFEYFRKNPQQGEVFNRAMTAFSKIVMPAVLEAYDFSGITTLADIAGGHGFVLASVLQRYPAMKGILYELEHVAPGARARFSEMGLAGRTQVLTGDFFQNVPSGADAYIMKHIIHDWDDEKAGRLLRNIHQALTPLGRGKVILLEGVLPAGNEPNLGKLIDLEMLVGPGGCERTEEQFRELFQSSGFRLTRIIPTKSPLCVVEAERV
jgi:O-methyltransferase domain/Dimerisation domain